MSHQLTIAERLRHGEPVDDRAALIESYMHLEMLDWRSSLAAPWFRNDDPASTLAGERARAEAIVRQSAELVVDHYLSKRPLWWRPGKRKAYGYLVNYVLHPLMWRAGGKCEDCGSEAPLEVHHCHYLTVSVERPSDFALLCRECHERRHWHGGDFFPDPLARPDAQDDRRRLEMKYAHLQRPPEGDEAKAAWAEFEAAERRADELARAAARLWR